MQSWTRFLSMKNKEKSSPEGQIKKKITLQPGQRKKSSSLFLWRMSLEKESSCTMERNKRSSLEDHRPKLRKAKLTEILWWLMRNLNV